MKCLILGPLVLHLAAPQKDEDWPRWRGPRRDGTAQGLELPEKWPEKLVEKWSVQVGEGHSSPIVADGKVFQVGRIGDNEVVRCLTLEKGEPVWDESYPAPYKMHSAARGHGKGPKSTPAYELGRMVTFSIHGVLSCWNAETGELIWRKEFGDAHKNTSPLYGTALSPLIHHGRCYVHVGGHDSGALVSFRMKSGDPGWSWNGDGPSYVSPIYARMSNREYIVTQSQKFMLGRDIVTGQPLFRLDFTTAYDQNSVTPLRYKDWIIYSGLDKGIHAFRMSTKEPLEPRMLPVWSMKDKQCYMSTPVIWRNLLIGMSQKKKGHIFGLDAKTGRVLWEGPGRLGDNAALVSARKAVFVVSTAGKLLVLQPDREKYGEVKSYDVAKTPVWAHPAFVGDRILIKDRDTLRCFSWK